MINNASDADDEYSSENDHITYDDDGDGFPVITSRAIENSSLPLLEQCNKTHRTLLIIVSLVLGITGIYIVMSFVSVYPALTLLRFSAELTRIKAERELAARMVNHTTIEKERTAATVLLPQMYVADNFASALIPSDAPTRFRDMVLSRRLIPEGENLIIVSFTSAGYLDFALEWICHSERVGVHNWIMGAIDTIAYDKLVALGYGNHVYKLSWLMDNPQTEQCGGTDAHGYNDACFPINTMLKMQIILISMLSGFHTLFSDMDVTFIKNPLLYLPLSQWIEIQREPFDGYCTGFMYWQSNLSNIGLMQHFIIHVAESKVNDQFALNEKYWVLRGAKYGKALFNHFFALSREAFPTGWSNSANSLWMQNNSVIQHNNWLSTAADKRARYAQSGLAVHSVDETTHQLKCKPCNICETFTPTISPIRMTWPGQQLHEDIEMYREVNTGAHPMFE